MTTDFFGRFLVSRNYKIQIVAHVERKSVVTLLSPGSLESLGENDDSSKRAIIP